MKKRIFTFVLAMIMILGMLPMSAFAASERTTSDAGIEAIKGFEGFEANEYTVGSATYIGYGTKVTAGTYPSGISKTQATELLKKELEVIDKKINEFAKNNSLSLTQGQHDALASISYNVGIAWLSGNGPLRKAVLNKAGAAEIVNAFAQNAGGNPEYLVGLMARRMKEANMYINGIYSAPANYSYVVLDDNGGTCEYSVYGYITTQSPALNIAATKTGSEFLGWYLEELPVTKLDSTTAGKTLVAKWDTNTVKYTVKTSDAANLNIYKSAALTATVTGTVKANSDFNVTKEAMADGYKWVYGSGKTAANKDIKGWLCMGKVTEEDNSTDTVLAIGKVTASTLVVRESATSDSKYMGSLTKDEEVKILGYKDITTITGTQRWGKIKLSSGEYGWISLAYVDLKQADADENTTIEGAEGVIVNTDYVNVRQAAGTGSPVVTYLKDGKMKAGTKVTILETTRVDGNLWGKIKWDGIYTGWVYMYYVSTNGTSTGTGTGVTGPVLYTGTVNSNMNLNVRKTPEVSGVLAATLPHGTKINIYETTMTNGVKWGRTDKGWVCMQYVNITGSNVNEETTAPSGGTPATVVNCSTAVNIRASASVSSALTGTARLGSTIYIFEVKNVNGVDWGRTEKGWVCMQYVKLNGALPETDPDGNVVTVVNGTVTATTLTIYKAATNNSAPVGTMAKGDSTVILEQVDEKTDLGTTKRWGKVTVNGITGWINLAYVDLKLASSMGPETTPDTGSGSTTVTGTGVIANCTNVNVRSAAGVGNGLVTTLKAGTKVSILEKVTQDNAPWARIQFNGTNTGWVCMYYVTLDAVDSGAATPGVGGTTPGAISATGYVNSNIDLNVRSGPGLGYGKVGALKKGTKVTVYEQTTADGMIWGKTNTGWVCMSYITIESSSSSGKGVMGTIARCFNAVNVRSAPGTGNALVGTILVGSRVEIYEQTMYSGQYWGRVAQGWICMQYVLLDEELPPTSGDTTTPDASTPSTDSTTDGAVNITGEVAYKISGFVTGGNLTVRKDATATSVAAGVLGNNTKVDILALKANGAEIWGRIDQNEIPGWICLDNVNLTVVNKYVSSDKLPVYAAASKGSNQVGALAVNTVIPAYLALGLDGNTVMIKVSASVDGITISGWIDASALAEKEVTVTNPTNALNSTDVITNPVYSGITLAEVVVYDSPNNGKAKETLKNGAQVYFDGITTFNNVDWAVVTIDSAIRYLKLENIALANTENAGTINGTTFAQINTFDARGGNAKETLKNGAKVSIVNITKDGGIIWGQVKVNGQVRYINMASVSFNWTKSLSAGKEVTVRTAPYGNEGAEIVDTLVGAGTITVSNLQLSATGELCGQILSTTATAKEGKDVTSKWIVMDSIG